jgi:hypothetical protein
MASLAADFTATTVMPDDSINEIFLLSDYKANMLFYCLS